MCETRYNNKNRECGRKQKGMFFEVCEQNLAISCPASQPTVLHYTHMALPAPSRISLLPLSERRRSLHDLSEIGKVSKILMSLSSLFAHTSPFPSSGRFDVNRECSEEQPCWSKFVSFLCSDPYLGKFSIRQYPSHQKQLDSPLHYFSRVFLLEWYRRCPKGRGNRMSILYTSAVRSSVPRDRSKGASTTATVPPETQGCIWTIIQ